MSQPVSILLGLPVRLKRCGRINDRGVVSATPFFKMLREQGPQKSQEDIRSIENKRNQAWGRRSEALDAINNTPHGPVHFNSSPEIAAKAQIQADPEIQTGGPWEEDRTIDSGQENEGAPNFVGEFDHALWESEMSLGLPADADSNIRNLSILRDLDIPLTLTSACRSSKILPRCKNNQNPQMRSKIQIQLMYRPIQLQLSCRNTNLQKTRPNNQFPPSRSWRDHICSPSEFSDQSS